MQYCLCSADEKDCGQVVMPKDDGIRLVLRLKSNRDGRFRVKCASHMRLDGNGELLLYDASHRVRDRVSLTEHSVINILSV
jgi:hypothetical protein